MKIAIHPLTADPTAAWRELSQYQKVVKITAKLPTTEAPSDKVRLIISYRADIFIQRDICTLTSQILFHIFHTQNFFKSFNSTIADINTVRSGQCIFNLKQ